nr:toprim domain-containing protein [Clostridioides difficile]
MIKEIIVVEGRDDVTAVKRAIDAELITTGGFGFPKGVMQRIKAANERRGVIIFTDPDFAGEKIKKKNKHQKFQDVNMHFYQERKLKRMEI